MKTTSILAILLFVGCNAVTSPSGTTTTEGGMTAKVNGASWSTVGIPGIQAAKATRTASTDIVTVSGAALDASSITLVLVHPHTGTDSLGISLNKGTFLWGTEAKDAYVSTSGSVTISKCDTTNALISGTFTFTGYQLADTIAKSVSITSGSFLDVGWSK